METPQLKVLHVEDSAEDAYILRESLSRASNGRDLSVDHVDNIDSALSTLRQEQFSAIILDLNLPDGNGIETLRFLKKYASNTPVIVVTGADRDGQGEDVLEEGAQEYLLKGYVNGDVLSQIIHSAILRQKKQLDLYHRAHYDELSGLPNRHFFEDVVRAMIDRAKRHRRREALLFVDLDKFKYVNDTFGHEAGDFIIREAAFRMKNTLRSADVIARYGGDEFVIYMDGNDQKILRPQDCLHLAHKIIKTVSQNYSYLHYNMRIGCSVGIAFFPDSAETYEDLIVRADQAMYKAKKSHHHNVYIAGM